MIRLPCSRGLRTAVLVLAALAVSACSGLITGGTRESPRILVPDVQVRPQPDWPGVDWQLAIGSLAASDSLSTARIAVRPRPGELEVYAGARWVDPAPDLVQDAVLRGFEDSGRIMAVSPFGGGIRGDFALLMSLRHFESVYVDGAPVATIEITARLSHFRGNRVVASRTFRHEEPTTGTDVGLVSEAFGRGLSTVVTDIVGWTLTEGERAVQALEAAEQPAMRTEPATPPQP